MTKTEDAGRTSDPFEMWRQLYDANERAWTAALEQTMGTREFGESSGKLLETLLAAQRSVRDNMRTYLETMNVPTREDIARLGELVIGLEEKIDQVGDRLDAVERSVRANSPDPVLGLVRNVSARLDTIEKSVRPRPADPLLALVKKVSSRLDTIEKSVRPRPADPLLALVKKVDQVGPRLDAIEKSIRARASEPAAPKAAAKPDRPAASATRQTVRAKPATRPMR